MIDEILAAASRRTVKYKIADGVEVTLCEMSLKDQFSWDEKRKELADDISEMYVYLIKKCCAELADTDEDKIREISPKHVIGMGDAIIEMSKKNTE